MTRDDLIELLQHTQRIVLVGGPNTGKSTLAYHLGQAIQRAWSERHKLADPLGLNIQCTDELVGVLEWSEASAEVARWLDAPGPWIIEGVATARALRKWLAAHPGERLDCAIVLLSEPFGDVSKGQAAMSKGVATVWNEIAIDVLARGARVINAASPKSVRESREGAEAACPEQSAAVS